MQTMTDKTQADTQPSSRNPVKDPALTNAESSKKADSNPEPVKTHSRADGKTHPNYAISVTKRKGYGILLFALFLLTITAISGSVYLWREQKILRTQLNDEIIALRKDLRGLDTHPAFNELRNRFSEQNTKFAAETQSIHANITRLDANFETLNTSITQLTDITLRSQRDWVLAEADYLLSIANTRLTLMQDKQTSIQALMAADHRLQALSDTRLLPLRKKLSEAITQLKLAPSPDIDGAILKLMGLAQQLSQLPPATSTPLDTNDDSAQSINTPALDSHSISPTGWTRLLSHINSLLGIHPDKKAFDTFAKQKNLYYLDQLLRIELEAARQAVLRYDREDYEKRLARIKSLLESHYNQEHEQVIQIRKSVAELRQMNVFADLPNITSVIDELHQTLQRVAQTQTKQPNRTEAQ